MRRALLTISAATFLACAVPLFAHGAEEHHLDAATVMTWWTWDPAVIFLLVVTAVLYAAGQKNLWSSAAGSRAVRKWEAVCFWLGWLTLVLALVSPVHRLSEILFSAHMAQHELLMLIAAPLLVIGRPLIVFLWAFAPARRASIAAAFQRRWIEVSWNAITGVFTVWVIHALALWIWHIPVLYEATLTSEFIHAVQHSCFLFSASLFWWALIHGRYGKIGYGVAVLYVFTTAVHSSILGALLTFAGRLWYPIYAERTAAWGMSPLEDQQLAGLLMWIPSGVIFIVLGLALFAAWLGEAERRVALTQSDILSRNGSGSR